MVNPLELLFPPRCAFCGQVLPPGSAEVCERCMDSITLSTRPPEAVNGAFFLRAVAPLRYKDEVRRAIHRFKFSGKQSYARPFARMLRWALEREGMGYDLIVSVPTNRRNIRKRGYNHADLLGRELARLTAVPYLDALGKTRKTEAMFGLSPAGRRANVLGAIALRVEPRVVEGLRVLVVDDVITTGATLSECARILRENGAASVQGAAVAMVSEGKNPEKPKM